MKFSYRFKATRLLDAYLRQKAKALVENRRHERLDTQLEAVYAIRGGAVHTCAISDYSRGGIFITFGDAAQYVRNKSQGVKVRDPIKLVFSFRDDETHIEGAVAHYSEVGMGVQFVNHSAQLFARLEEASSVQSHAVTSARKHFLQDTRTVQHDQKSKLYKELQQISLSFLETRFTAFLDELSEALLQAADRQKSDEMQHPYFDAMALFSKHQKDIAESVVSEIKLLISEVSAGKTPSEALTTKASGSLSVNQLSLVEKEEFEDWLVVRVVVSRADMMFREELVELQLRLEVVFPNKKGDPVVNPISPGAICKSFHRCMRHFRLGHNIEKLVFRILQESVINKLSDLYSEVNEAFIAAGVLPDIDVPKYLATEAMRKKKAEHSEEENDVEHEPEENEESALGLKDNRNSVGPQTSSKASTGPSAAQEAPAASYNSFQDSMRRARNAYSTASQLIRMSKSISQGRATSSPEPAGQGSNVRGATANAQAIPTGQLGQKPEQVAGAQNGVGAGRQSQTAATMGESAGAVTDSPAAAINVAPVENQVVVNAIDRLQSALAQAQVESVDGGSLLEHVQSRVTELCGGDSVIADAEKESIEMMDQLFSNIVENPRIAQHLKPELRKLQVPLLKALMLDPNLFAAEAHPARQVINSLALLSDKDSVNLGVNQASITQTINHILSNFDNGVEAFEDANKQLDQVVDREKRVIKRNLERVTEACRGQEKVEKANEMVETALEARLLGHRVPLALINLIDAGWRELMRLCFIREGTESRAWLTAIDVIEQLVIRLAHGAFDESKISFTKEEIVKLIQKGLSKIPPNRYNHQAIVNELEVLLDSDDIDNSELVQYKSNYTASEAHVIERLKSMSGESSEKSLMRWIKRAKSLQEGQWLEFDKGEGQTQLNQLAWVSENFSRYVFVNHLGMKVCDLSLDEIAIKLKKGELRILNTEGMPAVDQGLDALVQKFYDQLAFEAAHDQLTRLVTRKEFERCLARSVARTKKDNESYLLCFIDVQQFKVINNTCGYEGGDGLLKDVANRIKEAVAEDDVVGRLGGNEFGILSLSKSNHEAFQKVNKVKELIEANRFVWGNQNFSITLMVSMVVFDKTNDRVLELLRGVESAIEIAKRSGHKEIQVYHPSDTRLEERDIVMAWVARINNALDNNKLRLRCQKIAPVEYEEGEYKPHFEVLLTVVDDDGEHLPPADFIKAAEEYSRMGAVDRWVIVNVLQWIQDHPDFVETIGGFSVNLSGHSMNDDSFMDFIFEQLVKFEVPRKKLIFEVTETTAVANLEDAADFIAEMKEIGCRFSLDDFGAGQSSYAYLKMLPVDFIKIDGSFVKNISNDDVDYAMVKSITDMGHFLEKKIVAEFVVDQDVYETVADIGVDYVQGYHTGAPIMLDTLIESEEELRQQAAG